MNKEQAIHFINKLFQEVWDDLNENSISHYYHKDMVGHFGEQTIDYQDICHRLAYVKKHFGRIKTDIKDIIAENNKISVRLEQYVGEQDKKYIIIAIYTIKEGKVCELWACTNPSFNYFE